MLQLFFCKMSLSAAGSAVMIVLHVSCINWMDQGNIESIKIIHGCRRGNILHNANILLT